MRTLAPDRTCLVVLTVSGGIVNLLRVLTPLYVNLLRVLTPLYVKSVVIWLVRRCLRRSLLIGQLHPYNRGGHEESHPPVHLSHEPDRWDGVRYLRV